jgi:hypothetical protein
METLQKCQFCGATYPAKRPDTSLFCTTKCRVAANKRKRKPPLEPPSGAEIEAARVDPERILAEIAASRSASPAARVSAARALQAATPKAAPIAETENDRINAEAIKMMRAVTRVAELTRPADDDEIPCIAWHKGIGLHDNQSPARLAVVRAAIDYVIELSDLINLCDYARDITRPSEARLLAGTKVEAVLEDHSEGRQKRPKGLSIELVRAYTAGLSCKRWRSLTHYCSTLCVPTGPGQLGAVERERPLR